MNRVRSFASWGSLLFLLVTAVWFLTAGDREEIALLEDSLMQKQTLLHRLERLPEREAGIRDALQLLDDGIAERSLYRGEPSAVRTEVQRDVRALASNAGVRVGSMRPMGPRRSSDGKLSMSTIQVSYEATNDENVSFLEKLEQAEPMLRVQRMSVSVQSASTPSRAAILSVSLEVAGFIFEES